MGISKAAFLALLLFIGNLAYSYQSSALTIDEKMAIAKERCEPFKESDPILYMDNFKSGMSVEDMDRIYLETYNDEGRLPNRVGYYPESNKFLSEAGTEEEGDFPEFYIKSVIGQAEKLLKLNYVKYLFYSDMGHSHLFAPIDYYEEHIQGKGYRFTKSASIIMKSLGTKTLYHTAEQLEVRDPDTKELYDDTYLQWRFYTRNPTVGINQDIEILTDFSGVANTVRKYVPSSEGYRYYAGFYISANKNGCFPFENKEGEINYFDLSFSSPVYRANGDDDSFGFSFSRPNRDLFIELGVGSVIDDAFTHPPHDLIRH